MYLPLTTCTHNSSYMYMDSLHSLTVMVHVLTTSTYSRTDLGERHRGTCMTCTPSDLEIDLFSIWTTSTCTTGKSGGLFSSSSSSFRWKIERSKKQSFESSSCVSSSFPFCKKKKYHTNTTSGHSLVRIWVSTKVQTLYKTFFLFSSPHQYHSTGRMPTRYCNQQWDGLIFLFNLKFYFLYLNAFDSLESRLNSSTRRNNAAWKMFTLSQGHRICVRVFCLLIQLETSFFF